MRIGRVVDLSVAVVTGMPVYPGDPAVALAPATTVARDGYAVLHVTMGSQSGTHADAPAHFLAGGTPIDAIAPSTFLGRARLVDVRRPARTGRIGWADIAMMVERPPQRTIVLLHTGWADFWGTQRALEHPTLDRDAAKGLVASGVRLVGIDALSVDATGASTFPAHDVLLGAGVVVVENLTALDEAATLGDDPFVSMLPLRIVDADGAPVRAVACEVLADGADDRT